MHGFGKNSGSRRLSKHRLLPLVKGEDRIHPAADPDHPGKAEQCRQRKGPAGIIGRQISGTQVHMQKLEQLMFAEYLKAGYHRDRQRAMTAYYEDKCRKMERAMEPFREMGLSWQSPKGGLGFWCRLPKGINDMKLYEALRRRKVLICPGKLFFPGGTEEGGFMRLSFSNISDANIGKGISIIYDEIIRQDRK